jgi:hypothetical protein
MFVHEDSAFEPLMQIVAKKRRLSLAIVEKDYWVTHALWSLAGSGFDVWFKGGTSLSKGFGLIQRFSEDLDLKLEHPEIPQPNWTGKKDAHRDSRANFFREVQARIRASGLTPTLRPSADGKWRGCEIVLEYSRLTNDLPGAMSPSVLLEVGDATVTPFVACDIESFMHAELLAQGQLADFTDNRAKSVRCLHPLVTLLEKIDNLGKGIAGDKDPARFVRHFEDAARIIQQVGSLPPLPDHPDVIALAGALLSAKTIKPHGDALAALEHADEQRWTAIAADFRAIGPMFWGSRMTLDECRTTIRDWLTGTFG